MTKDSFIPLDFNDVNQEIMLEKSTLFFESMDKRRSVREFSDRKVDKLVIENILKTASTAPSGAHMQPWTFCVISNQELKEKIREAAEEEEYRNYNGRMSEEWLQDLAIFETDWKKEFISKAPYIIVIFRQSYGMVDGKKKNYYYTQESVGIACGFLIAAIHQAGLVSLTHTPSPMNFLARELGRPSNEKPFLLMPVGYPAEDCKVPKLDRKGLDEMSVFFE